MPSLNLTVTNDLTPEGIDAELRALKLAVAVMATRIPPSNEPEAVTSALKSTGDKHASDLADLIQLFIDQANAQK